MYCIERKKTQSKTKQNKKQVSHPLELTLGGFF